MTSPKKVGEREKTVQRMQQLMTLATLASCKRDPTTDHGYAVVDPMPPPALDSGVTPPPVDAGPAAVDAGPADASKKEAGSHAIVVPLEIEHKTPPVVTGYGVVDPLPPPAFKK